MSSPTSNAPRLLRRLGLALIVLGWPGLLLLLLSFAIARRPT